jgi:hypothetical protein
VLGTQIKQIPEWIQGRQHVIVLNREDCVRAEERKQWEDWYACSLCCCPSHRVLAMHRPHVTCVSSPECRYEQRGQKIFFTGACLSRAAPHPHVCVCVWRGMLAHTVLLVLTSRTFPLYRCAAWQRYPASSQGGHGHLSSNQRQAQGARSQSTVPCRPLHPRTLRSQQAAMVLSCDQLRERHSGDLVDEMAPTGVC